MPYDEIHVRQALRGEEGFYVDDRAIRPSEFLSVQPRGDRPAAGAREVIVVTLAAYVDLELQSEFGRRRCRAFLPVANHRLFAHQRRAAGKALPG